MKFTATELQVVKVNVQSRQVLFTEPVDSSEQSEEVSVMFGLFAVGVFQWVSPHNPVQGKASSGPTGASDTGRQRRVHGTEIETKGLENKKHA
jgi:hypothetical protein